MKRVRCRFTFWHGTQAYPIDCAPAAFSYGFCKSRIPFADFRFQTALGAQRFAEFISYFFFKIPRTTCVRAFRIRHSRGIINVGCSTFFNTRSRSSNWTCGGFTVNETIHYGRELEQCSGKWLSGRNVTGRVPPFRPFL